VIERTRRQRLYWLVDLLIASELAVNDFAREFDRTYLHTEDGELTLAEEREFALLHRESGWYALPEDRGPGSYPHLRTEQDVMDTARGVKERLGWSDA